MKTVLLGDTHGRTVWKGIIEKEQPGRVVFIGDYFDSHDDISGRQQIDNFNEIIKYKEEHPEIEFIMLIANHDHHYLPEVGYNGTSGYQHDDAPEITMTLNLNRKHLQLVYQFDDVLCSHAGISEIFIEHIFKEEGWNYETLVQQLNDKFIKEPNFVAFNGRNLYGDDIYQTPIWIRPNSLMKSVSTLFKNSFIQVVGHTTQNQIDIKGKSTGGRYYFIDTLGTSGEYLIHDNATFSVGKLNN